VSVPEHPLHFGPGTSITTPLKSKGLGFGLSWSCILKYANSRGCGNVVIPQGFPKSVGRVESRFLGFPCFPYSVISMACFGNARRTIKIPKRPGLGTGTVFFSRIFLPSSPLARACSGSVTGHRCEHVICCGPGATGSRNSALANPHSEWEAIGRLWRFSAKPKNPPPRIPSRNAHPTHPGWQGALSNSRLYERESAIVVCELLRFRGPPFGAIRLRRNGSARPRFPRVVYGDLIIPFLHRDTPRI